MDERSNTKWFAALAVTALVAIGGTWLVLDRTEQAPPAGEPVAAVEERESEETASEDEAPSWLFSQTAGAGTYTDDGDGTGTLVLTDVDPGVTAFTDRPVRDHAIVSVGGLVEAWPTMFADAAPNAVLVTRGADGAAASFVLELSHPSVDGTTMTYAASVVKGQDRPSTLPDVMPAPDVPPPAELRTVSLFIDDVPASKWVCSSNQGKTINPPAPLMAPASDAAMAQFTNACKSKNGTPRLVPA